MRWPEVGKREGKGKRKKEKGDIFMRNRFAGSLIGVAIGAAAVSAVITVSVTRTAGQASRPARTADGKPNPNGRWQANNEPDWHLQAHHARAGPGLRPGL